MSDEPKLEWWAVYAVYPDGFKVAVCSEGFAFTKDKALRLLDDKDVKAFYCRDAGVRLVAKRLSECKSQGI